MVARGGGMRPVISARERYLSLSLYGRYLNITHSKKIGIRSYSIGGTIGKGPVGRGEGREGAQKKEKKDRSNN